jgi:hypothetical protein
MVAVQIKLQVYLNLFLGIQTNVISCPLIRLSPQAVDAALPFRAKQGPLTYLSVPNYPGNDSEASQYSRNYPEHPYLISDSPIIWFRSVTRLEFEKPHAKHCLLSVNIEIPALVFEDVLK